ncbi:AsnC family transcriptional regulator [Streptomyces sp. RS10V-4]|uniref:Lrp/AsnC family transcriptional regulator n=1 Tax=Streptomyces rhizoryzae TaxID=2932493 RepID=UPI0020058838|nr:AsnC family transcriptional regulator [Streptomyces rhizoryzae]MCK7625828.1 AsnC family transcriptional regulator [Streptomyces rhizoryzae]
MDDLELRLLHALKIDGRASYSRLAKVLGVSDQTVARRYRKLRSDVGMRVIARSDPRLLGKSEWFVRLRGAPGTVARAAALLARREDASWVSVTFGGAEVVSLVRSGNAHGDQQALVHHLGSLPQVHSVVALNVLHTFVGEQVLWPGLASDLGEAQVRQLAQALPAPVDPDGLRLTDADLGLIEALGADGRTSLQRLAVVTDAAENTVRRRLEYLRASGALYFDLELDYHLLGFEALALLWLSVPPRRLIPAAEGLARHPEVSFVAATTGPTNLLASVICRDNTRLFDYLAGQVGAMPGVYHVEVAPITRMIKRVVTPTHAV